MTLNGWRRSEAVAIWDPVPTLKTRASRSWSAYGTSLSRTILTHCYNTITTAVKNRYGGSIDGKIVYAKLPIWLPRHSVPTTVAIPAGLRARYSIAIFAITARATAVCYIRPWIDAATGWAVVALRGYATIPATTEAVGGY